jgi:glycosyltransferase involved in cell wall biosynthesis
MVRQEDDEFVEMIAIEPVAAVPLGVRRQEMMNPAEVAARLAVAAQLRVVPRQPVPDVPLSTDPEVEQAVAKAARIRSSADEAWMARPPIKPFARALRVLHLTNIETSNLFINNLCDYSDRRVVQYLALTLGKEGGFTQDLDRRGIQAYALDCTHRAEYPLALHKLWQIIEHERIDIVHAHLFDPTVIGICAAKLRDRRLVMTRHHGDELYQLPKGMRRNLYLRAERWVNHEADHIIAPTQQVYDILVRREHVPEERVSLVPYGQTMERFDAVSPDMIEKARKELRMGARLALACIGRLQQDKGHRYLLEAFALLRDEGLDANLYLVGTGPDQTLLERLISDMALGDRVKFINWRDDVLAVIGAADIIVHPVLQEGMPAVVIEALMMERPLVVTDVTGVRDLVGNSKHGILIPPANADALHAAISWTVNNLDQARKRAKAGRQFVIEYLDAERVAREYFNIYRRVMKTHLRQTQTLNHRVSPDTEVMVELEA